jgi:hypothetical protein
MDEIPVRIKAFPAAERQHGFDSVGTGRSERASRPSQVAGAQLSLVWQETGGPTVATPTRRGFGTRLIDNIVRHELGGRLDLSLPSTGERCEIDVPLARIAGRDEGQGPDLGSRLAAMVRHRRWVKMAPRQLCGTKVSARWTLVRAPRRRHARPVSPSQARPTTRRRASK